MLLKRWKSFLPAGRSDGVYNKPCRHEKSPSKSNEVISPEILKMRAALFCIFTYLDTKTLLRAAEVCRDWKFVARHPAVWTRVLLENARISSKVNIEHFGTIPALEATSSLWNGIFHWYQCLSLSSWASCLSGALRRIPSSCRTSSRDSEERKKARTITWKAHGETRAEKHSESDIDDILMLILWIFWKTILICVVLCCWLHFLLSWCKHCNVL